MASEKFDASRDDDRTPVKSASQDDMLTLMPSGRWAAADRAAMNSKSKESAKQGSCTPGGDISWP